MKNKDELTEQLEKQEQQIELLTHKTQQLESAVTFLLNKAHLKKIEALEFTELYPEWLPGGKYPKGTYLTYGTDEDGNKQLYYSETDVMKADSGRYPGKDYGHHAMDRLYAPIQNPNIGKDEE